MGHPGSGLGAGRPLRAEGWPPRAPFLTIELENKHGAPTQLLGEGRAPGFEARVCLGPQVISGDLRSAALTVVRTQHHPSPGPAGRTPVRCCSLFLIFKFYFHPRKVQRSKKCVNSPCWKDGGPEDSGPSTRLGLPWWPPAGNTDCLQREDASSPARRGGRPHCSQQLCVCVLVKRQGLRGGCSVSLANQ